MSYLRGVYSCWPLVGALAWTVLQPGTNLGTAAEQRTGSSVQGILGVNVATEGDAKQSGTRGTMPEGQTIHVAPQGNDKSAGTQAEPLATLAAALSRARSGDTILLAAGTYRGAIRTQAPGVTIEGRGEVIIAGPADRRGIEVLHDRTTLRRLTIEKCDIGVWLFGVRECLLEELVLRDLGGEGVRIKNQSCDNRVVHCRFERMGLQGFDVQRGRKNGEGVYIGTAPEQRGKNQPPNVPDCCTGNRVEDCFFRTLAAEAVDIKEDSEQNLVLRCRGEASRDPDGAIFGSRGDRNRFENCVAIGGTGHGFRFGGDTVPRGKYGQTEERTYGKMNIVRNCRAEDNARWGLAAMVQPQDLDQSNHYSANGQGAVRP